MALAFGMVVVVDNRWVEIYTGFLPHAEAVVEQQLKISCYAPQKPKVSEGAVGGSLLNLILRGIFL